MRAKGYRIKEAETWEDVISCCRNAIRRARKVFQQQPENGWQVAMIERNGRLVLSVKPVPFVPSDWAA